jgi:hypothetical protein
MKSLVTLLLLLFCTATLAQNARPGRLLVFYGWPSTINGANTNINTAAGHFSQYSHVVFGEGIQDPGHEDHQRTRSIIAHSTTSQTLFFGYIPLGARPGDRNLSQSVIAQHAQQWAAMGVDGVLLDEYGYDYEVSRARQNAAVDALRANGLLAIANAWRPADAFGTEISSANPIGIPTRLDSRDYYMAESYQVIGGVQTDPNFWRAKEQATAEFRANLGFKVVSITTPNASGAFNARLWDYAWYSAAMHDHTAVGWGELFYSAGNSLAPFRVRPTPDGQVFVSPVSNVGARYSRRTCAQELWIDASTASGGHFGAPLCSFHTIGGTITGMDSSLSVTLRNSFTGEVLTRSVNGVYTFATSQVSGATYNVLITTQPTNQTCSVQNGSGVVGTTNITNIQVSCQSNTVSIGGNLSGLAPNRSIDLQLNGGSPLSLSANGSFTFPASVLTGSSYTASIANLPLGQTCTLQNAVGIANAAVNNIAVQCLNAQYSVGGTVGNLVVGQSLVLRNDGTGENLSITAAGAFQFVTTQMYGAPYNVRVLAQPAQQFCLVQGDSGIVTGNVQAIELNCGVLATNTTIVARDPQGSTMGELVQISFEVASLSGTPMGEVSVSDGLHSCSALASAGQCSIRFMRAGERSLTASFSGSALHAASTSQPVGHMVSRTIPSFLPLPSSGFVGEPMNVGVVLQSFAPFPPPSLSWPPLTGTIEFLTVPEVCVATLPALSCFITPVNPGARNLTAFYSGDDNYTPSGTSLQAIVQPERSIFQNGFE